MEEKAICRNYLSYPHREEKSIYRNDKSYSYLKKNQFVEMIFLIHIWKNIYRNEKRVESVFISITNFSFSFIGGKYDRNYLNISCFYFNNLFKYYSEKIYFNEEIRFLVNFQ
jgi:hypothetical protein